MPSDYPFKPPAFVMLTPSGRFETGTKICLSISSFHPESWQPSWSVRSALIALIAFMQTPGNGAVGSLDVAPEIRRQMATEARNTPPKHVNIQRQELINTLHQRMLDMEERSRSDYKQSAHPVVTDASLLSSSVEQEVPPPNLEKAPAIAAHMSHGEENSSTAVKEDNQANTPIVEAKVLSRRPQTPESASTRLQNEDLSVSYEPPTSPVITPAMAPSPTLLSSLARPPTPTTQMGSWEDRGLTYASVLLGVLIALILLRKLVLAFLTALRHRADDAFSFTATSLTDLEL